MIYKIVKLFLSNTYIQYICLRVLLDFFFALCAELN